MSILTEEEINHFAERAFEKRRDNKRSKFAFCKITYPTLPSAIDYTRKVLCTAVARVGKFGEEGDARTEKLRAFLEAKGTTGVPGAAPSATSGLSTGFSPEFLVAVCARTPVRLGYSARLYDIATVEDPSTLRDIKEMYLKEDEIAVRAKVGSYDIVDALSSADAVDEYRQLHERLTNNAGQRVVEAQEESGFYRELDCWLNGVAVSVSQFNKLLEEVDPITGHNVYNSESFTFTDKANGSPYEGEFTIETVFEHGKESEAKYSFRSFNPKIVE